MTDRCPAGKEGVKSGVGDEGAGRADEVDPLGENEAGNVTRSRKSEILVERVVRPRPLRTSHSMDSDIVRFRAPNLECSTRSVHASGYFLSHPIITAYGIGTTLLFRGRVFATAFSDRDPIPVA